MLFFKFSIFLTTYPSSPVNSIIVRFLYRTNDEQQQSILNNQQPRNTLTRITGILFIFDFGSILR